ncbi:MAG: hypothetical protein Q7S83_02635 [bacterium]|nr:hypothetical protein [bacterium]
MASYDRSAQRNEKKGKKKGGGGQQPARKRKYYSIFIPVRKVVRMLKSCSAEFVGKLACKERQEAKPDEIQGALHALADDGASGEYGERVQELAKEALEYVK